MNKNNIMVDSSPCYTEILDEINFTEAIQLLIQPLLALTASAHC